MTDGAGQAKRRGAQVNPTNRFERFSREVDPDAQLDAEAEENPLRVLPTETFADDTRQIVAENDSPDLWFRYSLNPYRGCEHGCVYCYARPFHEYLGWNAGLDFETKILVKRKAPELLTAFLRRPGWEGETIVLSGVTDCYQPLERSLRLTRACLEVMAKSRQPAGIVTKSRLILRDLDLLVEMAKRNLIQVSVAVTTLDEKLAREMEPRAAAPEHRLEAIRELARAGVPVRALLAPMIPGLTDQEIPAILQAAKEAGAIGAGYVLLRLPGAVRPVFLDWLDRVAPLARPRVEARVRDVRGGELNDPRFGARMKGTGEWADRVGDLFKLFAHKHGLDQPLPPLDSSQFQPPPDPSGQGLLFE